ncbi:hypothetical protein BT96DRAFT_916626 [Gymnopus androsaceus JB14]|uniref:Uncharacterized protein n=1 Tax=Gymnopus androsaceus JB14 TaxID=1447944 RepID=A0A6A4I480_9AGAR|nr:hypothetical protein BT96DRAFT_916626 [Gymnopus androsaceus JB14]
MSLTLGSQNSVPFPAEAIASPMFFRPKSTLHRRRGVELSMPLQMPLPPQFGFNGPGTATATVATANVFTTSTSGTSSIGSSSSGLFGSGSVDTFWSPASAVPVVGSKGPLQPHVSNLPRRKTVRRVIA